MWCYCITILLRSLFKCIYRQCSSKPACWLTAHPRPIVRSEATDSHDASAAPLIVNTLRSASVYRIRRVSYFEIDRDRAEWKVADDLFPETGSVGRARRTPAIVPEPNIRIPAAAAATLTVVQSNGVLPSAEARRSTAATAIATCGRPDRRQRRRPLSRATYATVAVHGTVDRGQTACTFGCKQVWTTEWLQTAANQRTIPFVW